MSFLFAKDSSYRIIILTKNEKTIESNIVIGEFIVLLKKNSPILSKPNLPIHTPIPRSIFSLQKEVQSHACKPVLGFSLPKMGYDPFCKGLRCSFLFTKSLFQISWLQNKTIFLQRFFPKHLFAKSTVFKMKIAFCKVFFCGSLSFLQRNVCGRSSFLQRNQGPARNFSMATCKVAEALTLPLDMCSRPL